jgi:cytochrome c peroxidase
MAFPISNPNPLRALLGAALLTAVHGSAQLPTGTLVQISPPKDAEAAKVELLNPGNHTWILQSSTDLASWTDLETFKVHNGRFRRTVTPAVGQSERGHYRLLYNPAGQTLTSTLANGLLLPVIAANYSSPTLPATFFQAPISGQDNTPQNNAVTNAGATLGRALFYDKRLSLNQTVSCSSCHQAQHGFSDPRPFSVGFEGGLTDRNSMGLSNARWYQRRAFFWDERAATLEDQVLQPIQNSVEMGMTLPGLVARLSAEPYYAPLFTQAFGSATVNSDRISKALAQFVRSIISTQSKYDAGRVATPAFSNFTAEENLGRTVFSTNTQGNCVACHGSDNFVPAGNLNNNGLENPYIDKGRGEVTGLSTDEGLFKAPSLRNIELTAPYMHDGRFASLEQVVEFYNSGVVNHPNLSPPLRNPPGAPNPGQPRRLNLTTEQKAALVAFLKTLTDRSVTTDPRFQDPFNYGD